MNPIKVKQFWEAQAKKSKTLRLESIANLEETPELLSMKVELETSKVMPALDLRPNDRVLDLGAGVGQWAFRIARVAKYVCAVEYSLGMLELGREQALQQGIDNVEFVHLEAQNYVSDCPFDLIYISGLLIYLSDDECEMLVANCANNLRAGGRLVLRDGTGVRGRHEIDDHYSESLQAHYSAIYRPAESYLDLFERNGFTLDKQEDMFEEGNPLNKWPETRLRLYCFRSSRSSTASSNICGTNEK